MKLIFVHLNGTRTKMVEAPVKDPVKLGLEPDQVKVPVTESGKLIIMANGQIPVIRGLLNEDFFSAIRVDQVYMLRFRYKFIKNQAQLDVLMQRPGAVLK